MKTLAIGDIHTKIHLVQELLDKYEKFFDEVVFLGDEFDDYDDTLKITEETAYWLKDSLNKSNRKHLWANHTFHYKFFKNGYVRGSGYSRNKADVINRIMKPEDWIKLKFFYQSQGFIFSHAGFHRGLLHPINGFDADYIETKIYEEYYYILNLEVGSYFGVGKARGGNLEKGGFLWQDWDLEFEPVEGIKQIVGHTHFDSIQEKNGNYCVDTLPYYVMSITDGIPKFIKISHIGL
jgi:hypothetical protein